MINRILVLIDTGRYVEESKPEGISENREIKPARTYSALSKEHRRTWIVTGSIIPPSDSLNGGLASEGKN
jgi:hypothetical protein